MQRAAAIVMTMLSLGASPGTGAHAAEPATHPQAGEWAFQVLLDGKPIGQHRFTLSAANAAGERTLVSEADFVVKVLGLTFYRYRHRANEQWRADCLASINSTTDDNGEPQGVRSSFGPDCVMSYAYWNTGIQAQRRLVNPQTGRTDTVQLSRAGEAPIPVRGTAVAGTRWRISGPEQPVDVWYSGQGEWIGLDATVRGGRVLSYRLP